ncbi:hypothetical protein HQN89_02280 [Paenibacillus frigoriresistens]|uniref:hypothetical protein n=1 Tax=Paenibacillus alginolyticus TaxID=59839 RepID=UPI0015666802|nr:hypothetical protein [Paenibacillus frigoriresistens]NRF89867.1 hypothetical protein [Paenibacillus frigoriresistens]
MEITLRQIKQDYPMKNILVLKSYLQAQKKKGTLFIKETISELQESTIFNLYFYKIASPNSKIDAFPVPILDFQIYKNKIDQYNFMKYYFEKYYPLTVRINEFFELYNTKHPFVGTDYIWFSMSREGTKKFILSDFLIGIGKVKNAEKLQE